MAHSRAIEGAHRRPTPTADPVLRFFEDDDLDPGLREFFSAGSSAMGWVKGEDLVEMKCRVCGTTVNRSTVGIVTGTIEGGTEGYSKPRDNMYAMPVCPTDGCQGLELGIVHAGLGAHGQGLR